MIQKISREYFINNNVCFRCGSSGNDVMLRFSNQLYKSEDSFAKIKILKMSQFSNDYRVLINQIQSEIIQEIKNEDKVNHNNRLVERKYCVWCM